jgi:threonine dehydratase
LQRIELAAERMDPVFLRTPQFRADLLERKLGCGLVLKIEVLNPIRSFKGRGASWFMSQVTQDQRLVCASAGNFGQAMAYAARSRGIPLTIFASMNASPFKIERMRSFGADVRLEGQDFDAAKIAARTFAEETGATLVEDSQEPATCEGAGTIGIELLQWPERLDVLLVALGNGALLTGIGRWAKAHSPQTAVIGICARGAPAMADSWHTGRLIAHPSVDTIADGIAVRVPIPEVLSDMKHTVDDVILVSDDALLRGIQLLHEHVGLVAEPAGAAGLAALLTFPGQFKDKLVATVICGGNLSPEQIRKWLP